MKAEQKKAWKMLCKKAKRWIQRYELCVVLRTERAIAWQFHKGPLSYMSEWDACFRLAYASRSSFPCSMACDLPYVWPIWHWRFKGQGAYGGYLGIQRRRRASWPTKCSGELGSCEDPEIPEWGNPKVPAGFWLVGGNLANWNILVARGRESKRDSPSSGERRGNSLNRLIRGCGRTVRVFLR